MFKVSILFLVASTTAHPASPKLDDAVSNLIVELDQAHLTSKPMMKTVLGLEDIKLKAGQSANLQCQILSIPAAVFFWERNGQRIQGDEELNLFEKLVNTGKSVVESGIVSSTYHIPCATHKDAGVYRCVAYNGHSRIESTAVVEIEGEDSKCPSVHRSAPLITMLTESRFEMAGNAATLVCRADRKASWTWMVEGEKLNLEDGRYEVLPTGDLLIRNITWGDMGDYECVASNKYGSTTGETFLYPTKKKST